MAALAKDIWRDPELRFLLLVWMALVTIVIVASVMTKFWSGEGNAANVISEGYGMVVDLAFLAIIGGILSRRIRKNEWAVTWSYLHARTLGVADSIFSKLASTRLDHETVAIYASEAVYIASPYDRTDLPLGIAMPSIGLAEWDLLVRLPGIRDHLNDQLLKAKSMHADLQKCLDLATGPMSSALSASELALLLQLEHRVSTLLRQIQSRSDEEVPSDCRFIAVQSGLVVETAYELATAMLARATETLGRRAYSDRLHASIDALRAPTITRA